MYISIKMFWPFSGEFTQCPNPNRITSSRTINEAYQGGFLVVP